MINYCFIVKWNSNVSDVCVFKAIEERLEHHYNVTNLVFFKGDGLSP